MTHAIEARAFLVIGFDHRPGRIGGIGVKEHRLLGFCVVVPFIKARLVNW
jgi:hypothetical protein